MRTLRRLVRCVLTAEAFFAVYYQIQGNSSPVPSRRAFDPHDRTTGRVLARTTSPTRTAANVKRYIAQLEGIDPSRVEAIYPDLESDRPIPDDTRIATLEGGPGTSMGSPLAISVRDPDPELPLVLPPPFLELDTPPSPPTPLPEVLSPPDIQIHPSGQPTSLSSRDSLRSLTTNQDSFPQSPPADHRWIIGEDGVGEPIESPTEALKVVSEDQPPGWLSSRLQCIGHGMCVVYIFHANSDS